MYKILGSSEWVYLPRVATNSILIAGLSGGTTWGFNYPTEPSKTQLCGATESFSLLPHGTVSLVGNDRGLWRRRSVKENFFYNLVFYIIEPTNISNH